MAKIGSSKFHEKQLSFISQVMCVSNFKWMTKCERSYGAQVCPQMDRSVFYLNNSPALGMGKIKLWMGKFFYNPIVIVSLVWIFTKWAFQQVPLNVYEEHCLRWTDEQKRQMHWLCYSLFAFLFLKKHWYLPETLIMCRQSQGPEQAGSPFKWARLLLMS